MKYISDSYLILNQELHKRSEKFGGGGHRNLVQVERIARKNNVISILDYGCGKGSLINCLRIIGYEQAQGYDPAVEEWKEYPKKAVDMVVCCDVLEHVEEEFVKDVLSNLRNLTKKVFYTVISLVPSDKTFSNGGNAHITLFLREKWMQLLVQAFPGGLQELSRGRILSRKRKLSTGKLYFRWEK